MPDFPSAEVPDLYAQIEEWAAFARNSGVDLEIKRARLLARMKVSIAESGGGELSAKCVHLLFLVQVIKHEGLLHLMCTQTALCFATTGPRFDNHNKEGPTEN